MENQEVEECVAKCLNEISEVNSVSSIAIALVHKNIPGYCIKGNPDHLLISLLSAYHNLFIGINKEELKQTIEDIKKDHNVEDKENIFDTFLKINDLIEKAGIK
jgi:hypothetical protein